MLILIVAELQIQQYIRLCALQMLILAVAELQIRQNYYTQ